MPRTRPGRARLRTAPTGVKAQHRGREVAGPPAGGGTPAAGPWASQRGHPVVWDRSGGGSDPGRLHGPGTTSGSAAGPAQPAAVPTGKSLDDAWNVRTCAGFLQPASVRTKKGGSKGLWIREEREALWPSVVKRPKILSDSDSG
jgi:hypothetical protein